MSTFGSKATGTNSNLSEAETTVNTQKSKFVGTWKKVSDVGFREMLVHCGCPWLLSFVIVRKEMKLTMTFTDDDPNKELHLVTPDHEEFLPMDGTFVDVEVTNPFKRKVSCNVVWENNKTMKLIRKDDVTNSMKKVGTLATITRCLTDDNTITSTIDMKRTLNSDGKVARAVITLKRQ